MIYFGMKQIKWDIEKNVWLKGTRGVSFDELVNSRFISIEKHPTRKHQNIMLFEFNNYVWAVPYVREKEYLFFKTAFPSRKYTKKYLRGDEL